MHITHTADHSLYKQTRPWRCHHSDAATDQTRRYKEIAAALQPFFFSLSPSLFLSAGLRILNENLCTWLLFRHQRIAVDILFYLFPVVFVNAHPYMSYYRVLPAPPSLANQDSSSWSSEPDSLLRHKIMTTETSNNLNSKTKSLTPSQKPSSPAGDKAGSSPGLESLEDYIDSPQARTRSSSQISNESYRLEGRLPSVSWHGESPSQICLCQPDPKIPRPRNGMSDSLPISLAKIPAHSGRLRHEGDLFGCW